MAYNAKMFANRILKTMKNFRYFEKLTASESYGSDFNCVSIVGVYADPKLLRQQNVIVCEEGLINSTDSRHVIPYSSIYEAYLDPQGLEPNTVVLVLLDGKIVRLPISGREGRFYDAFEFIRFIRRTLEFR